MSRAYIAHDDFLKAIAAGDVPDDVVLRKQFVCEKAEAVADKSTRKRSFVISTAAVDRDNDVISPKGWNLDNYRKNPVVLFAHDYKSLPIGKCVNIKAVDGKLIADCEFADHEMASTVLRLVDGGFLNATSVGFRPTKYALNDTRKGVDYEEQELLEYSIVPVPANPEALIVAREFEGDVKALAKWASDTLAVLKGLEPPTPDTPQVPGMVPTTSGDEAADGDKKKPPKKPQPKAKKPPVPPDPQPKPSGNDDEPDGGEDVEPDDPQEDPDPDEDDDAKKAVANAVADIATALKDLPVLVATALKAGCACMASAGHKAASCSCCKSGGCEGTCCMKATDDAIAKAGRVLSGKNEAKIRAAHGHLSEVLQNLPDSNATDNDADDGKDAEVVVKDGEIIELDFDDIEFGGDMTSEEVGVAIADAMKDALGVLRESVADAVKRETESALNRLRGRLD